MKKSSQRGTTLVELMIAMTLALMLSGAAALIAVNSKSVFRANLAVARLQDNARFAVDSLTRDLRMAGFNGCAGGGSAPVNKLTAAGFQYDYTNGLLGFHAVGASWSPALDASITGLTPPPLAGTDVMTVRTATGGSHALTATMAGSTAALTIDANSGLSTGDIVMAANCSSSVAFEITANPGTGSIAHAAGGAAPGNSSADLGVSFSTDASVYRLVTRTYYIAPSVLQPGTDSLWVYSVPNYTGSPNPQEIVEGVQNIALLYGEDTDGDGVPNRYVTANAVGTWANVVAVRAQLLMQTVQNNMATSAQAYTFSGTTVTAPGDLRLRAVMNSTISVRNRSK
jgi:type IV pilus assembly protein PilW